MTFKQKNRALFLAMQADAKDFPGGIRAVAEFMGRNGNTLGNQFNPDHEAAPPSLEVFVELIKLTHGTRSAFAIAQLVDQVLMDVSTDDRNPAEAVQMFMRLVHEASELFAKGSEFARDLHFDANERKKLEPLLMALIKAAVELLKTTRG
jgi:hypothetical protein